MSQTSGIFDHIEQVARGVQKRLPEGAAPRVGLVLGSGLGDYADTLAGAVKVPYGELPGFPVSRVVGHAGNLVYGRGPAWAPGPAQVEVLAMQGRVHFYEGHSLEAVVLPIRVLIACGCDTLVLTNAAGGIGAGLRPGQLVLLSDHLNLFGGSPLRGENDGRLGPRFPDLSSAYDPALRALGREAGRTLGVELTEGVYAGCAGPQYETPAEVRMLRLLGADLVGMSTVPETIAARHMGARVLGISCVTNLAAGLSGAALSHDEVTETAARVRGDFIKLLDAILALLAREGPGRQHQGDDHDHAHE
jgi:purine-nucleoside phosphorylase